MDNMGNMVWDAAKELALGALVGACFGSWQHSIGAGILAAIVFIRFA